jgi:hypothetical protein
LFRFDMSEFQTQESLGLLLGARLGEKGYLGAMRERAAEGSLLLTKRKKRIRACWTFCCNCSTPRASPLPRGRRWISAASYVWLTSNIGSAELMSLQHSNDATLERHVLSRAQQALRPEIFARINEKLVFNRLSYEHQLEIAEKFLTREIEFLAARGHKLELDKTVAVPRAKRISSQARRAADARRRRKARGRRGQRMSAGRSPGVWRSHGLLGKVPPRISWRHSRV